MVAAAKITARAAMCGGLKRSGRYFSASLGEVTSTRALVDADRFAYVQGLDRREAILQPIEVDFGVRHSPANRRLARYVGRDNAHDDAIRGLRGGRGDLDYQKR